MVSKFRRNRVILLISAVCAPASSYTRHVKRLAVRSGILLGLVGFLLLASASAAQFGRGRQAPRCVPPGSYTGSFLFCRISFRNQAGGRRRRMECGLPAGRSELVVPARGADQDADQPRRERRNQAHHHPPDGSRALPVSVHHDDGARRRVPRCRGSGGVARLPAQGRVPVGGRLLGRAGLGGLGR